MMLSNVPFESRESMEMQTDMSKAIQLLKENSMDEAADRLRKSCQTIDALQQSIALMEQLQMQLKDATMQLDKQEMLIKDQSKEIQQLKEQLARNERSVFTRIGERIDALRHGLSNVKDGLIQSAADLVMSFRMKGKEALVGARELFHVEGKLTWLQNCVDNGVYEMNKAVDKQQRLMNEYQRAADAVASADHAAGKDTSFAFRTMEAMRDHHTNKCSLYEKAITVLSKMSDRLGVALEHNRSAIEAVRGIKPVENEQETMNKDEVLELA